MKDLLVVKVGTSSLVGENGKLDKAQFESIATQIARLKDYDVLLVTSAAISAGAEDKNIDRREFVSDIETLQYLASVGQVPLMERWRDAFAEHSVKAAQFLITAYELSQEHERVPFVHAIAKTLEFGDIPVINENDATAIEEIKYGDNDRISALVAVEVMKLGRWQKGKVLLLSDIDGFYRNYGEDNQTLLKVVNSNDDVAHMANGSGSHHGSGGMQTKLEAARIASGHGLELIIGNGRHKDVIDQALQGIVGTRFV